MSSSTWSTSYTSQQRAVNRNCSVFVGNIPYEASEVIVIVIIIIIIMIGRIKGDI